MYQTQTIISSDNLCCSLRPGELKYQTRGSEAQKKESGGYAIVRERERKSECMSCGDMKSGPHHPCALLLSPPAAASLNH